MLSSALSRIHGDVPASLIVGDLPRIVHATPRSKFDPGRSIGWKSLPSAIRCHHHRHVIGLAASRVIVADTPAPDDPVESRIADPRPLVRHEASQQIQTRRKSGAPGITSCRPAPIDNSTGM